MVHLFVTVRVITWNESEVRVARLKEDVRGSMGVAVNVREMVWIHEG